MTAPYRFDNLRREDVPSIVRLWRACFPRLFLSERGVLRCTFDHPGFRPEGAFVARGTEGEAVGFGMGADHRIPEAGPDDLPGCVPVVMVRPRHRKRGIGGALLKKAEAFLAQRGHRRLRAGYPAYVQGALFSLLAVNARWLEAVWFFKHYGYAVTGATDSASVSLEAFEAPGRVLAEERRAAEQGVSPGRLKPEEAEAFLRFLEGAFDGAWHRSFARRVAEGALDFERVFVLRRGGEIIGFVGPFDVSESGAAAMGIGIGLAADWRGRGLGRPLLYGGLRAMKESGARSCVLYGMGPKRYYEEAGFRLDGLWISMRKDLSAASRRARKGVAASPALVSAQKTA